MIAVFDSGLGGLTLLAALRKALPQYDLLFLADTACGPYGEKSLATVMDLAANAFTKLNSLGAKLVVSACGTTSALNDDIWPARSPLPVMETISPLVAAALAKSRTKRIGVLGSATAMLAGVHARAAESIDPTAKIHTAPAPLLSPLLENRWWKKPEANMIVKKYVHPLKTRRIDTLILAECAYAPLAPLIQRKSGRRVKLVDTPRVITQHLKHYLATHPDLDQSLSRYQTVRACVTDLTDHRRRLAKLYYGANIDLELV